MVRNPRSRRGALIVALSAMTLALMTACNREPAAWEKAQAADTVVGYETYLSEYPDGDHASMATSMLAEARGWQSATAANTEAAVSAFITDFPSSRYMKVAKAQLVSLVAEREAKAFEEAKRLDTRSSYTTFLKEYPEGANAPEARRLAQERLVSEFRPDAILFIGYPGFERGTGVWRGPLSYSLGGRGGFTGRVTLIPPNPTRQRVAVVVNDATGLPASLERGNVYIWNGGEDFVFLRAFKAFTGDSNQQITARNELSRSLGLRASAGEDISDVPFFRRR